MKSSVELLPRWNLDLRNINKFLDRILSDVNFPQNKRGRPCKREPGLYQAHHPQGILLLFPEKGRIPWRNRPFCHSLLGEETIQELYRKPGQTDIQIPGYGLRFLLP